MGPKPKIGKSEGQQPTITKTVGILTNNYLKYEVLRQELNRNCSIAFQNDKTYKLIEEARIETVFRLSETSFKMLQKVSIINQVDFTLPSIHDICNL